MYTKFYELFEKTAGFSNETVAKALLTRINNITEDFKAAKDLKDIKHFLRKIYRTTKQVAPGAPKDESLAKFLTKNNDKDFVENALISAVNSMPIEELRAHEPRVREILMSANKGKGMTEKDLHKVFRNFTDAWDEPDLNRAGNLVKKYLKDDVLAKAIKNNKQIGLKDLQ